MTVSLVIIEGLAMCFDLVMVCIVLIANGAVGGVVFYEKEVRERVVELGLTTKKRIARNTIIANTAIFIPMLFLVPLAVYFINGAKDFFSAFWQMSAVYFIMGIFDRLFIDEYWVGKTKAWFIPGTEDLMPYIPAKTRLMKWIGTVAGNLLYAAFAAWAITLINGG